tara:strand:+ start:181 stop:1182 length:1002 start_codon:yes stop_codon:yes gene_type:complete
MKTYPTFKVNITKEIEFSDPITLDDISQTVEEYIHTDKNNIVILYDADSSGVNKYFFTNRSTDARGPIMNALMEDVNSFYGCKDISDRIFIDNTNLDTQTEYLSLRSIGMHVNHNYCNMEKILDIIYHQDENDNNYKNQLYVLYNLDKGFKSYASLASVKAGVAQSSALHCQAGYDSKTSVLLNAQPATTDYEQNLNEPEQDIIVDGPIEIGGPPYEPNSPDGPPPDWSPSSPDGPPPDWSPSPPYDPNSPDGTQEIASLSPIPLVIDTPDNSSLSSMDIQTGGGGDIKPNCPQVTGGRRKTRRNKRKCGRKSRKMNKTTNKHRRSNKSKPAV